jgi:hypothetical protein
MPDADNFSHELAQLKSQPSVSLWEVEIRKILLGKRDHAVVRLGGAQEYIEVILEESEDEALAQTIFNEAMKNVIQSWQPARPESAAYFSFMLDIIGAYTPAEGFIKVLGFINSKKYFGINVITPDSRKEGKDLHMKALVVLQYYYPVAPPSQSDMDIAFRQYLGVLREHLQNPKYNDYALRRLYELNAIDLQDEDVSSAIENEPSVINEIISIICKLRNRDRAQVDLSALYAHSLRISDGTTVFEQALTACGARLEHDDYGPLVYLSNTELIVLDVPEDVQASYILIRWSKGQERGFSKLEGIVSIHSTANN